MYCRPHIVFTIAIAACFFITCNRQRDTPEPVRPKKIAILPFDDLAKEDLISFKNEILERLNIEITVLKQSKLPTNAFYKPRQRYIADSILVFLRAINNGRYDHVLGVTSKDISTSKKEIVNWGIFGLGDCPGKASIISSFRMSRKTVTTAKYHHRMIALAFHELGHNFGLPHCEARLCVMNDVHGKMKLDNTDSYCLECEKKLKGQHILK